MTNKAALNLDPKSPETVRLTLGRRSFNVFLRTIHEFNDDSWKAAQIELTGHAVASSKYDRIEVFTDTLIGPIVAQREAKTEDVYVTMQLPSDSVRRTADEIVASIRSGDVPPRS